MEIIDIGMKLMKLFLFLFSLYSLEYKIYANGNQDSFKENTSSNINEFQNKFNLNKVLKKSKNRKFIKIKIKSSIFLLI